MPFPGLKKVLRQKTSKQNPEGSRRENRKNEKQIVAASYATRISAANQVTQLESKPRSKPQFKIDAKLPATNYYGRKNLSGYQPQLFPGATRNRGSHASALRRMGCATHRRDEVMRLGKVIAMVMKS